MVFKDILGLKFLNSLNGASFALFKISLFQIAFYEERNFLGRHYECSFDCPNLHSYFRHCNSIRVQSGCWVLYERPNYMGYQYVLTKGEYPDYHHWMGSNSFIGSCRMHGGFQGDSYRMRVYERPNFGGQMMEFMDNCPSMYDQFHYRNIHSCNVMNGYWTFYEHPNYMGRQYFLRPGQYRRFSDWGASCPIVGSMRRMKDF
ncbi:gamma-crystallin M2-like [Callorhinchus milii]|uniref:gamma-crystallin M2-like n=1 Tax=Callorhinchus milii TaxID=7868 RepID=UPI001C3F7582|nr:gamma-crystallin M2-like [Callorhinchus milii]